MEIRIDDWGKNRKIVWVNSESIEKCMKVYYEKNIDVVGISPHIGFKLNDLSFLKDYRDIKKVRIATAEEIDISIIQSINELLYLSIGPSKQNIDLSDFTKLDGLVLEWHKGIVLPESNDNLKELRLRSYNSIHKNLEELPYYINLQEIEISVSPIVSLKGISKYHNLNRASFKYLTKLEDIGDINSPTMQFLNFDTCKKIRNHENVTKIKSLTKLRFNKCSDIPSLKFINELPNLEDLRIVDTNVLDGDMTPCFNLKSVGFFKKKHYSHTPEEVEDIINQENVNNKMK